MVPKTEQGKTENFSVLFLTSAPSDFSVKYLNFGHFFKRLDPNQVPSLNSVVNFSSDLEFSLGGFH